MGRIKTVFHVHTDYSDDSNASVESILTSAAANGVGCVTITDHDTIAGARAMAQVGPRQTAGVVGQEISTRDGHLIGLFLQRRDRAGSARA